MLQNKSIKIFDEMKDFFTSSEKAIFKTIKIYEHLKLNTLLKKENLKSWEYPKGEVLLHMMLFPLSLIKNVKGYVGSFLFQYFGAGHDVFYRFKKDSQINWRHILDQVNERLQKKIQTRGQDDKTQPKCLIVDDTEIEKRGIFIEHVSRVWSHVSQKSILGFKGLFLGYWDSKTFIGLDFSLHKEKGKNIKYPFGLTKKQLKAQYKKKRNKSDISYDREKELQISKIEVACKMIDKAKSKNVNFEYLLADSWFVCEQLLLCVLNTGANLLGMAKLGKTNYNYRGKRKTAKSLIELLKRNKNIRYSRKLHMFTSEIIVSMNNIPVKLFFYKTSKRARWHMLLSSNTKLSAIRAYEIYSIRWSIEVFFKEAKQYFNLGQCQSRDFDAQIADISLIIMQYNIFSLAKRFTDYETLGELFKKTKDSVTELTVCKRIWGFILELLSLFSDIFAIDIEELVQLVLNANNNKQNKILKLIEISMSNAA